MEVIHRSQILNAPYNPRKITGDAKRRLRESLSKLGMLAPITWNKRSGFIVGGHQRIQAMDALNGTKDYSLHVASVDLDDSQEREANVLLNNSAAQGDWDLTALQSLLSDGAETLDVEAMGFTNADIWGMFGTSQDEAGAVDAGIDQLTASLLDADKEAAEYKPDTDDFYIVLVGRDTEQIDRFLEAAKLDKNERYHDIRTIAEAMGIDLE